MKNKSGLLFKIMGGGLFFLSFSASGAPPEKLPLPRFAALKSDKVNMRKGPGYQYPIAWILIRRDLPVEIVEEFENWRKIRDSQNSIGWVHHSLLTGKRTVIVKEPQSILKTSPSDQASGLAHLEEGVVGVLVKIEGEWCQIKVENTLKGWLKRTALWGV